MSVLVGALQVLMATNSIVTVDTAQAVQFEILLTVAVIIASSIHIRKATANN